MDHNLPDHLKEMTSDGIDTAQIVPAVDFLEIWTLMYRATVALTTVHAIPADTIRFRIQTSGRRIDTIFAGTIRQGDEVAAPTTEKGEGDKTWSTSTEPSHAFLFGTPRSPHGWSLA